MKNESWKFCISTMEGVVNVCFPGSMFSKKSEHKEYSFVFIFIYFTMLVPLKHKNAIISLEKVFIVLCIG